MNRTVWFAFAVTIILTSTVWAGDLKVEGKFISTEPTGSPPLEVSSTTAVSNLNADRVDGFEGSDFYTVTELGSSGAAAVHFNNITNVPTDGVKEINQDCATGAGCFSSDSGGFPVSITEPGSYRLTSNLDLSSLTSPESRDGIVFSASRVMLDLNGFAILGGITCTGTPVTSCSATGSGAGVHAQNTTEGAVIRNGSIKGFGTGIACNHECRIEDIFVTENGFSGISVSNGAAIVRNNRAFRNGENGITAQGVIVGNTAQGNLDYGIFSQPRSIVKENEIADNGGNGVRCVDCLLEGNTIQENGGFGVEIGSQSGYGGNVIVDNASGNLTGSGLQIGTNVCDGGVSCP